METVSSQSSGKFSTSFQKRKRRILCTFPDVVQKKLFVRPGLLLLVLIAAAAVVAVAGRVLQHHANTNTNVKSRLLANWKHHGSVVTTMDWRRHRERQSSVVFVPSYLDHLNTDYDHSNHDDNGAKTTHHKTHWMVLQQLGEDEASSAVLVDMTSSESGDRGVERQHPLSKALQHVLVVFDIGLTIALLKGSGGISLSLLFKAFKGLPQFFHTSLQKLLAWKASRTLSGVGKCWKWIRRTTFKTKPFRKIYKHRDKYTALSDYTWYMGDAQPAANVSSKKQQQQAQPLSPEQTASNPGTLSIEVRDDVFYE